MKTIEIYWQDINEAKQKEILEVLGDNGNYDVFPLAILEFEQSDIRSPLIINLISTYEELFEISENDRLTEYFGDYGDHFFKHDVSDEELEEVMESALGTLGMTLDEYVSRSSEFIYRENVRKEMQSAINNLGFSL